MTKYLSNAQVIRASLYRNKVLRGRIEAQMRRSIASAAAEQGLDLDPNEQWEVVHMRWSKQKEAYVSTSEQKATHVRFRLEQVGEEPSDWQECPEIPCPPMQEINLGQPKGEA